MSIVEGHPMMLQHFNMIRHLINREGPYLPLLDTEEIIVHMPEGEWKLPNEPIRASEKKYKGELDFMVTDKIERFHRSCRDTFQSWVSFLNQAERGSNIVIRTIEEGLISGDLASLKAFNQLQMAFQPRFETGEVESEMHALVSCRNAFLYLLTEEQSQRLGFDRPTSIDEESVQNVKYLVQRFNYLYG